jgi:hypothetical protein
MPRRVVRVPTAPPLAGGADAGAPSVTTCFDHMVLESYDADAYIAENPSENLVIASGASSSSDAAVCATRAQLTRAVREATKGVAQILLREHPVLVSVADVREVVESPVTRWRASPSTKVVASRDLVFEGEREALWTLTPLDDAPVEATEPDAADVCYDPSPLDPSPLAGGPQEIDEYLAISSSARERRIVIAADGARTTCSSRYALKLALDGAARYGTDPSVLLVGRSVPVAAADVQAALDSPAMRFRVAPTINVARTLGGAPTPLWTLQPLPSRSGARQPPPSLTVERRAAAPDTLTLTIRSAPPHHATPRTWLEMSITRPTAREARIQEDGTTLGLGTHKYTAPLITLRARHDPTRNFWDSLFRRGERWTLTLQFTPAVTLDMIPPAVADRIAQWMRGERIWTDVRETAEFAVGAGWAQLVKDGTVEESRGVVNPRADGSTALFTLRSHVDATTARSQDEANWWAYGSGAAVPLLCVVDPARGTRKDITTEDWKASFSHAALQLVWHPLP